MQDELETESLKYMFSSDQTAGAEWNGLEWDGQYSNTKEDDVRWKDSDQDGLL